MALLSLEKAPAPEQGGAWPPHTLCRETGTFPPPCPSAAQRPPGQMTLELSMLQPSRFCAPDSCANKGPSTGCHAARAFLPPSPASGEAPRREGPLGRLALRPGSAGELKIHGGCGATCEVAHGGRGTLRIPLSRPISASAPVLPGGWGSILLNREAITPPSAAFEAAAHGQAPSELPPLRPRRASAPDLLGGWGREEPACPALPQERAARQPPAAAHRLLPEELLAVYSNQARELQLGSEAVVKLAAAAAKAAAIAVFSGRHGPYAADAVRHFLPSCLHARNQGCPRLDLIYVFGLPHCCSVCVDSLKL